MELREGETIIHKGRPHWIVFGWAILLGLLSARFILGADPATSREASQVCLIIAGMLALYALGAACVAQLYRWSSRLILTNRRVVLKAGILRQRSSEFLLPTIESVLVEFPVAGRPFQLRHPDSPGLRWESGAYQAYSETRARARTHPGTAIACPPPGSCLEKGRRPLILSLTLSGLMATLRSRGQVMESPILMARDRRQPHSMQRQLRRMLQDLLALPCPVPADTQELRTARRELAE